MGPTHLTGARHTVGTSSTPNNPLFLALSYVSLNWEVGRLLRFAEQANGGAENIRCFLKVRAKKSGQDGRPTSSSLSVLQTTAALFGEGERIPSRTPRRGQQQGLGRAQRSAGRMTSSTEAEVLVGAALPPACPPSRPGGAGQAEGSLRRTKMKLLLSARIHTPKPRIIAPRIWKRRGQLMGALGAGGVREPCPAVPVAQARGT